MNQDIQYLRDVAQLALERDSSGVKEIQEHAQRLFDIADRYDALLDRMVEVRGLVRVIIQNAPVILEMATPPLTKKE